MRRMFTLTLSIAFVGFILSGCTDSATLVGPEDGGFESAAVDGTSDLLHGGNAVLSGTAITNLVADLIATQTGDPVGTFTGRIANLRIVETADGVFELTGRLIGTINGQRINQLIELTLTPDLGDGICQILFLEIGPIFLDLLGLEVEVPDPIIVEIRANPAGGLLGQLLAGLLC